MLVEIIYCAPSLVIFGYLLSKFYFNGPSCKSKNRLDGKVVVITGANCGIGYETALDLAGRGATVILACRDLNKANKSQNTILLKTKNEKVFAEKLDLSDLRSIKDFADMIKNRFKRLDILINNAGACSLEYKKTADGFESNFGSMHLGHFYLTYLLLDLIKKSAPSRIINVSSYGHQGIDMKWDDLQLEKSYSMGFAYRQAKLANILFTVELSKRLKGTGVTSVSLHPGTVRTEIFRGLQNNGLNFWFIMYTLFFPLLWIMGKDCKQGAQTTIHCAVADEIPEHDGKYFSDCKVVKSSAQSTNMESAKRLWQISEKLLKIDKN